MKQKKIQNFLRELVFDLRWSQLFAMVCLMILSLLFIYSATYRGGNQIPPEVIKQCKWFGVGFICYILICLLDYHWLCRKAWLLYVAVLVLLVWVLKSGKVIYGARRWLTFQGWTIQPSEFAKLSVLLALCYFLSRCMDQLSEWRRLAFAAAIALVPTILIHKQPDLGTALVVVVIFLSLLFLAGAPKRFFGLLGIIALIVGSLIGFETHRYAMFRRDRAAGKVKSEMQFRSYLYLKGYQLDRILGVAAPNELDRLAEGWNLQQSLIAIGSGGFTGKGWKKGDVTRGGYLPRTISLNDFVFAVLAEEAGFLGVMILTGLYLILLFGGIKIALKARDSLGMLVASGVTCLLFFHVFVNIGMTLGILPIVGVPLPLMSYGGSFVLVCMISLGLLQSVWLHRKPY